MRMASFYKTLQADNLIAGGLGQGGGGYWQEDVGERLQAEIADQLGAELTLVPRPHGRDSFDTRDYGFAGGTYDLAYCQLFDSCDRLPAEWIYSIISDYISMEAVLQDFLNRMKPNVLITFQYPLEPPEGKDNLVVQCNTVGCKVVFLPWFNSQDAEDHSWIRDIDAMCTGKIGGTYPFRDAAFKALEKLQTTDGYNIILSGNPHGSTFPLEYDQYIKCLNRCHYYVTGGIYDMQIPPKYYEICNHGATLVSPELPMMAEAGFVDGETYVRCEDLSDLESILKSDRWRVVGPAGRRMVQERHNIYTRAREIADLYREWLSAEAS